MAEFETAEGTVRVVGDELRLDRPGTRRNRYWTRIRRGSDQPRGRILVYLLGLLLLLLLVLFGLGVSWFGLGTALEQWYRLLRLVVPVALVGAVVVGIAFGIGALKGLLIFRREGIDSVARPARIPLDDIVKVISLSHLGTDTLLVIFQRDDQKTATQVDFLKGMDEERETARELFEANDVPVVASGDGETEASAETTGGTAEATAGASPSYSNWWYGVALLAGLEILGYLSLVVLFVAFGMGVAEQFFVENAAVVNLPLIVGGFLGLVASSGILIPLYVLSIFMDARKLAKRDAPWSPNPYVWGAIGLVPVVGQFTPLSMLSWTLPVALLYLGLRNYRIGLFR